MSHSLQAHQGCLNAPHVAIERNGSQTQRASAAVDPADVEIANDVSIGDRDWEQAAAPSVFDLAAVGRGCSLS